MLIEEGWKLPWITSLPPRIISSKKANAARDIRFSRVKSGVYQNCHVISGATSHCPLLVFSTGLSLYFSHWHSTWAELIFYNAKFSYNIVWTKFQMQAQDHLFVI